MKRWKVKMVFLLLLYSLTISLQAESEDVPKEIKVKKIWDLAEHSAFSDLIKFKGNYYCSFREGSGHVPGTDGLVRILMSKDAKNWESVALLKKEGIDLRDPKLSITPEGRIMVIIGGSIYKEGKLLGREPQASFSDKSGKKFSNPEKVTIDSEIVSWGDWIWRVTWYKGTGYAIDYQIGPQERRGPTALYLVKTTDGKKFQKVSKIDLDGFPNEATIRFDETGGMFVLIRRELEDKMGVLAKSSAPYTNWEFTKLDYRLGGPNFIFYGEKIIVGTRIMESDVYTGLLIGDTSGNLRKILKLPSGGDTSYPGLILEKDRLLVSYYSSHEEKTSIYIAEIPLSFIKKMEAEPTVLNSKKIWDKAPHCAFTDLVRYKGKFYCTFREASDHVPTFEGDDGKIRVLASSDGESWKSVALIEEKDIDLRDPKLSVMPDGRLMITCGGSDYDNNKLMEWHTRVIYSENGEEWTKPFRVRGIPSNNWFFRLTWKGDTGYVAANICKADPKTGNVIMGYAEGTARKLIVYKTTDGMNYEQVSEDIAPTHVACEATIRFKDDSTMFMAIRNAGSGDLSHWGMFMESKYPYKKFTAINKIDHILGGPNILQLEDNKWLLGTRGRKQNFWEDSNNITNENSTVLLRMRENGIYDSIHELPSGGQDTGYPGFAVYEDELWVSYYSSHEGTTAIYIANIPLNNL
jgi:hypothetical protein